MVSYFLRWTLLKFFSSFSNEQSQQKVRQWSRITCVVINTSIQVKCPLPWEFWIYNFSRRILERFFVGSIVNIRNECLFSLGSWGMNRSAEQTNRSRTASRFTRFVCPSLRFIPHEPRKKDTHSLNNHISIKIGLMLISCWIQILTTGSFTVYFPFSESRTFMTPSHKWHHKQTKIVIHKRGFLWIRG